MSLATYELFYHFPVELLLANEKCIHPFNGSCIEDMCCYSLVLAVVRTDSYSDGRRYWNMMSNTVEFIGKPGMFYLYPQYTVCFSVNAITVMRLVIWKWWYRMSFGHNSFILYYIRMDQSFFIFRIVLLWRETTKRGCYRNIYPWNAVPVYSKLR